MPRARWDTDGSRVFETGVDQGMLYVDPLPGVPWNGISSVAENASGGSPKEYFVDGRKYISVSSYEDYAATVSSFTLPDELAPCMGSQALSPGIFITGQPRKQFGFSYRTLVGDDIHGTSAGYRIHLVYGAHAGSSDYSHETMGDSPSVKPYSVVISTVPEDITGYRPSAHFIIDSRKTDPRILSDIEDILYGNDTDDPRLISVFELMVMLNPAYEVSRLSGGPKLKKMISAAIASGLSVVYRGGLTAAPTAATSYALPLTGWSGANPAAGDILVIVVQNSATVAQTWGQSAGSTWTKVADNEGSGKAGGYSYAVYYRVMQAGDSAPTFTWTTSSTFIIAAMAMRPLSGTPLAYDVISSKVDAGTSGAGVTTIDPAAATSAGDGVSLVLVHGRAATNNGYASHTFTPPSGWTTGIKAELLTGNPRFAGWAYKAGLGSGASDPGATTLTDSGSNTWALSAVQLLAKTTG
jgi:hypothetical protein